MPSAHEELPDIPEVVERSSRWLLARQDPATGGWKALQGDDQPSSLNTAEVLIALLDVHGDTVHAGSRQVRRGVEYLISHQIKEGADRGAWPRDRAVAPTPDLVRTSFAIQALLRAGEGVDEAPLRRGVRWLEEVRNPDGGWGFRREGPTELMPTCFALLALTESCKGGLDDCRAVVDEGLSLLVDRFQNADGSFGAAGPLVAPHTIYGVMVLQEARRNHLSRFPDRERKGLDWLLRHPDASIRLVEEEFPIGEGAYGFLYMTDSILLKVLSSSPDKRHQESFLVEEALNSVKDKMHPEGGFYGSRTFSWSTAKVVTALAATERRYPRFPTRKREFAGPRIGPFILGFAVLLGAGVVWLSLEDRFGVTQALFFVFLMLAALLAYGRIGEDTFKSLGEGLLDRLPGGPRED